MSALTRHVISENFYSYDLLTNQEFSRIDLLNKIDFWKYILKTKCDAKKYESILIGLTTVNIDYLAICFASAELSLKIVIVDYSRTDEFEDINFFDPKTKLLSPIDIFLHDIKSYDLDTCTKHKFFVGCSTRSFNIYDNLDYSIDPVEFEEVKTIFPDKDDILMRCTSSGTTGTPKIVEHTHHFLTEISKRNSKKFKGKCLHIKNLNHGSSLAVFLLPSLISNDVSKHLFYPVDEGDPFDKFISAIKPHDDLDFLLFPYPFMIDKFVNESKVQNIIWKNLKIQTLSYIQDSIRSEIKDGNIESITSIFGSNETSGPVFEITINKNNLDQESTYFKKLDDFFKISLKDNGMIEIGLPYYDSTIVTNDVFYKDSEFYIHKGRSDIVKINGEIIEIKDINNLNTSYTEAYIVTDTVTNCLYLAYWDRSNPDILKNLVDFLKTKYPRLKINKTATLNKKQFLTGIKLDNELLREYFRNYV
jgi:hypothetical protein